MRWRRDDAEVLHHYTIGDDVLSQSSFTENGFSGTAYLLYDGHGSTRQLANEFGVVTAQYAYDAYGVMLGQTADAQQAQATSLLYSGERFDTALQQYDLRARHYNPANGQFTSLDPYAGNMYDPQSLHKYAYCHSDPVNYIDPSGEIYTLTELSVAMTIASTIGGAMIGGSMSADSGLQRTQNALCGAFFGYFAGTAIAMTMSAGVVAAGYMGWGFVGGTTYFEANMILVSGTAFYSGASQNSAIVRQLGSMAKSLSRVFDKVNFRISIGRSATPNAPNISPSVPNNPATYVGNGDKSVSQIKTLPNLRKPLDPFPYKQSVDSKVADSSLAPGEYVYVMDERGVVNVLRDGPHLHPKVLGGAQSATGAGTLKVSNESIVTEISNCSGTFRFGPSSIPHVIDSLRNQGVQVSPTASRPFLPYSDCF